MVSLSFFLSLNAILVTVSSAAIARDGGNDYYPSIFVLYEVPSYKRDSMPDNPVERPPKWSYYAPFANKWGPKANGYGVNVADSGLISDGICDLINKNCHLPKVLQDMISHKSEIQPYNPGDEETYRLEYFAYDNNENWNKLDVGGNEDQKVSWHGPNDDCLSSFTFKLPEDGNYYIDAYQNNDKWDLYVSGGNGDIVGDCKPEPKELSKIPAVRLSLCHVWGVN